MTTVTQIARCATCKSDWIAIERHVCEDGNARYRFHCFNCFTDTALADTLAQAAELVIWQPILMYQQEGC